MSIISKFTKKVLEIYMMLAGNTNYFDFGHS